MTTQLIEAARLALEALETLMLERGSVYDKALTALRAALEQPAQKKPQNCGTSFCSCIECVLEQPAKSESIYIMGNYVGEGKVASVTLGGVSFAGNGTAGREADVRPTGFFFQMPEKIGSYTSDNPEHQKLDLSLCDAKRVQLPVGEVYGWHGFGRGQPMCTFDATEVELPVGTKLYTRPQAREPLTDEQIEALMDTYDVASIDYARAIEAAHGIKGEA